MNELNLQNPTFQIWTRFCSLHNEKIFVTLILPLHGIFSSQFFHMYTSNGPLDKNQIWVPRGFQIDKYELTYFRDVEFVCNLETNYIGYKMNWEKLYKYE
jgi:hypothetical protein